MSERKQLAIENLNLFTATLTQDWKDYLNELAMNSNPNCLNIDWNNTLPIPRQLRNPSIILHKKEGEEDHFTYLISQVWLVIMEDGSNEIIIPEETSGSMMDYDTKEVIHNFNGLPSITPSGVKSMARVVITKSIITDAEEMRWYIYTKGN